MIRKTILAAGVALAVVSTAAVAAVNYDPASGGFVGKGDVSTLYGWNNAQANANAGSVVFTYEVTTEYDFECEWTTGPDHNRTYHKNSHTQSFGVPATTVDAKGRLNPSSNLTGFILDPIDTSGGSEPTISCNGFGAGKTVVPGSVVEGATIGGLAVTFGGVTHALPNTL